MAMSHKVSMGLGAVLLAGLLGLPPAEAATPVPFPKTLPSVPGEADLQAVLADRQAFMGAVDRYIQGVLNATEAYRAYVERVQHMLASCEVESDLGGFEGSGFEEFVADGSRQCKGWVSAFNQHAQAYAAELDEAQAFQKTVQRVSERAQIQIDRIRIALHAKQLKAAVDDGLQTVKDSREAMKPWQNKPHNHQ